MKLLIAAGANVNVRDKQGKTPLMWAAVSGNVEGIKELLLFGAQVNVVDKHGKSALMYAAEAKEHSKEISTLLRDAGAIDKAALNP